MISEHKAMALFTAPTAFRAIKREDPDGTLLEHYDLSKFRTLFLAGERGDPPTIEWAQKLIGVPVDRSLVADRDGLGDLRQLRGARPLPVKFGSTTMPSPGWKLG